MKLSAVHCLSCHCIYLVTASVSQPVSLRPQWHQMELRHWSDSKYLPGVGSVELSSVSDVVFISAADDDNQVKRDCRCKRIDNSWVSTLHQPTNRMQHINLHHAWKRCTKNEALNRENKCIHTVDIVCLCSLCSECHWTLIDLLHLKIDACCA